MAQWTENQVRAELQKEGWEIVRGGWPDFLLLRRETNADPRSRIVEVQVAESKSDYGELTRNQRLCKEALETVGIKWRTLKAQGSGYPGVISLFQSDATYLKERHTKEAHRRAFHDWFREWAWTRWEQWVREGTPGIESVLHALRHGRLHDGVKLSVRFRQVQWDSNQKAGPRRVRWSPWVALMVERERAQPRP